MAIDPNPSSSVAVNEGAIENEIPTYRAISGLAVVSSLFGLASALSFADFTFLVAAAAAVVTGLLAERKIRRFPDVLTGRGFAQAGVALGLVCGLASITIDQVQSFIRQRQAIAFARSYLDKQIRKGTVAEAIYLKMPPENRKGLTPDQAFEMVKKQADKPMMIQQLTGPVERMQEFLAADPAATADVVGLEGQGVLGIDAYANVLLRFRSDKASPPEQYGLLAMKTKARKFDWFLDTILFPYTPKSYKPAPRPVDDGHGHGH